jgi:hypothetical protein
MTGEQEAMLDECLNAESGLSGWELDFVENLDQNFRDRPLSEKQVDRLIEINAKVLR